MSRQDDIRLVIEQEKALVFTEFDEAVAFRIGSALRDTALAGGLGIVADVRTWERPLFYMAMPGTTGDNPHWVRRKANLVQRVAKNSYRVVLEKTWEGDTFPPRRAFDDREMALVLVDTPHGALHDTPAWQRRRAMAERWREHGFDVDLSELWYVGDRNSVVDYLTAGGWSVTARRRPEVFAEYGRTFPESEDAEPQRNSLAVVATRQ